MVFLMRAGAGMLDLGPPSALAILTVLTVLTKKPYLWQNGVKCIWNVGKQGFFPWWALRIGMVSM
jgi:hypothetical protein